MGGKNWVNSTGEPGITREIVLVVEDSPTQAAQTRALLMAHGVRVMTAFDGQDGVEKAELFLPGLIILDWEMPRMNGGDVVRVLKSNPLTSKIPIIIFTRHDSPEVKSAGLQEGAVDFIPKDAFAKVVMVETLKQMGIIQPVPHP